MARKITAKAFKFIDDKLKTNGAAQEAIKQKQARRLLRYVTDVCVGVKEHGGNNKGDMVEEFQKTVGGKAQGEAWCMAYAQTCIAYVEKKLGVQSPIFASEHCMTTWRNTPKKYRVKKIPAPMAMIIWKNGSTDSGHVAYMLDFQGNSKNQLTNEGNTGGNSMRDGDGVYIKQRSKVKNGSLVIQGYLIPFES